MPLQASPFVTTITKWLLFLTIFMTEAVFRHRDYAEKSIDFQIILKLAVWSAAFGFCLYCTRLWIKRFSQIDNIFIVVLFALIGISCLYAPNLVYSLASAFSLLAVVLMFFLASSVLSTAELLKQIILACSAVIGISLVVYFVYPELGRMKTWVDGVWISSNRLSGITGTANASGYIAAMALLCLYFYRHYLQKLSVNYWLLVTINLAGLLMSNSRTAIAALILALLIAALSYATPARLAAFFLGICLLMIAAFTVDYDMLFRLISRSGNVQEITSGTGRADIWAVTLDLISQKPLFGWGYASSNLIIPAAAEDIGFTASHAHNAFLQIALSTGYVGLFIFVVLMIIKIFYALKFHAPLNIAFIFFLLIDGLTEPVGFNGPATTTILALATVLALNYSHTHETNHSPHQ